MDKNYLKKARIRTEVTPTPEKTGDKSYVDTTGAGRTIEQMVARAIAMGEFQQATQNKGATHGTRAAAIQAMDKATEAPQYLTRNQTDTEINKLNKKIEEAKNQDPELIGLRKTKEELIKRKEKQFIKEDIEALTRN